MDLGMRHTQPIHQSSDEWQKSRNWRAVPIVVLGIILVPAWSVGVAGLSWAGLLGVGLGWALLWLAIIDARSLLLPNKITYPLIAAGLLAGYTLHPALFMDHVIGAVAGYLVLWSVSVAFETIRGHAGLGMGDAKLFAAAGAWLTWQALPSVLAIASFAGLALALVNWITDGRKGADGPLPFGPPMALGIWLVWLYGPILWVGAP